MYQHAAQAFLVLPGIYISLSLTVRRCPASTWKKLALYQTKTYIQINSRHKLSDNYYILYLFVLCLGILILKLQSYVKSMAPIKQFFGSGGEKKSLEGARSGGGGGDGSPGGRRRPGTRESQATQGKKKTEFSFNFCIYVVILNITTTKNREIINNNRSNC